MPRVTLASRLPAISASLRPRVSAAVKEAAEVVATDAEARVHVDSGDLRDSIHVERHEAAGYLVVADARADDGSPYGIFEEFGTGHSPAHPFMVPALESQAETAEHLISASLRAL